MLIQFDLTGNHVAELLSVLLLTSEIGNHVPEILLEIMKTVKGKGVSFMENQVGWHGKAPNDEQYAQAMVELEKAKITQSLQAVLMLLCLMVQMVL